MSAPWYYLLSLSSALLRSVEGEELAEYSKRAYSVYRTHGVIQDETELDDYPASEPTAYDLSLSANQLSCLRATSPPASRANFLHGASRSKTIPTDDVDQHGVGRKECGPVGVGVRDAVTPFLPPPSSPQLLRPEVEAHDPLNSNGISSAEFPAPTSGHELRVIDFSEAEDVVSHKPDIPATSPLEKFRSRLRAPRAGRALALASANARGNRGSRREETSPRFHRDVPGKELQPPPPQSSAATTAPPRRKEAWTEHGGGPGLDLHVRRGGHEPEPAYPIGLVGSTLVVSDEDEDGIVAHSSAFPKKAVEHGEGKGGKWRPARQGNKSRQDIEEQEHVATGDSEHSFDNEHVNKVTMSKGWPIDGSTTSEGCVPITSPAPGYSPRLKATTPRKIKDCRRRCDKTQPPVTRLETGFASSSSSTPVLVAPPPLNTRVQGLHQSRNGDNGDEVSTERESLGEPRTAPDNKEFLWFGQPDTPAGCQSDEDCENTREVRDEEAPAPASERTTAELQFGRRNSSPHQQHQSKAQFVLQMEVRRQRAIIEQASQAREDEGRLRRARIGAEVFKRIQDLRRRRRSPSSSTVPTVPPPSCPKKQPSPAKRESSTNDDQEKQTQVAMHRAQDVAVASPSHAEKTVKAWGFRPALAENTAKAVQPERLVHEATPSEGVIAVAKVPPAETLAPVPPAECAHRAAAAADNPWRRVVSRQKQPELESGSPAKRGPTPPPIRFDVEANAFGDGVERPDGEVNHEQENARRQERYEALRARKIAEADVSFFIVVQVCTFGSISIKGSTSLQGSIALNLATIGWKRTHRCSRLEILYGSIQRHAWLNNTDMKPTAIYGTLEP